MADKDLKLALLMKLNNQLSKPLKAATDAAQKDMRGVSKSVEQVTKEGNKASKSMQVLSKETKNASKSVESLTRAANAIKPGNLAKMSQDMGNLAKNAKSALGSIAKLTAAGAAGGYAGFKVAQAAASAPMSYDRKLALLSNTANSNLDATGRIRAKQSLHTGIENAVKLGGGSKDDALEALNSLVGSGAFGNANQALSMLPTLQKTATGSGAKSSELAQIMVAAKQTMGISDAEMPAMLSKALKAGQEGGFELSDMAKWLPQQMSLAGANGMKGMQGFESLLGANQVSRITAGTSDEAGNNLVNLLAKLNSQDTQKDFQKLGINLPGSLAAARGKGVLALDAFTSLVENISGKDKDYAAFSKKARQQSGVEQKATYEAMADIMMQKGIGKTVQDRQALMALLALIQQKEKYTDVKAKARAENGREADTSYSVMSSTLDEKSVQLGNKKDFAAFDLLSDLNAPLSKLLDTANELASVYPKLTESAVGVTTAFGAVTAAAGVGGLASILMGGSGGAGGAATKAAIAGVAAVPGLPAYLAAVGGIVTGTAAYNLMPDDTQSLIGGVIAQALANFGNKEAQRAIEVNLHLDSQLVSKIVTKNQAKEARRY